MSDTHVFVVAVRDHLGRVGLGVPDFVVRLDVRLEELWNVDDDGDDDDRDDVLEETLAASFGRVDRLAVVDRVVHGDVAFCQRKLSFCPGWLLAVVSGPLRPEYHSVQMPLSNYV